MIFMSSLERVKLCNGLNEYVPYRLKYSNTWSLSWCYWLVSLRNCCLAGGSTSLGTDFGWARSSLAEFLNARLVAYVPTSSYTAHLWKKKSNLLDVVVHTCTSSTWEEEARGLKSLKLGRTTEWIPYMVRSCFKNSQELVLWFNGRTLALHGEGFPKTARKIYSNSL